jgi:hypothetical protein
VREQAKSDTPIARGAGKEGEILHGKQTGYNLHAKNYAKVQSGL